MDDGMWRVNKFLILPTKKTDSNNTFMPFIPGYYEPNRSHSESFKEQLDQNTPEHTLHTKTELINIRGSE